MKNAPSFLSLTFLSTCLYAQIPNAGFENWHTDSAGTPPFVYQEPDDWFTYDSLDALYFLSSVEQETNAHDGTYAVRIQTVDYFGTGTYTGELSLARLPGLDGGVAVSQRYYSLDGWILYETQGNDSIFIYSRLYYNNTGVKTEAAIATRVFLGSQTAYMNFSLPFHSYRTQMPDSLDFLIIAGSPGTGNGTIGTYAVLDQLSLTPIPAGVPTAPTGLIASAQKTQSNNGISLDWDDNSNNESGFRVERSLNLYTGFISVDTLAAGAIMFTDTGLNDNTVYYYQVIAFNGNGDSPPSNVASAQTGMSTGVTASVIEKAILMYPNPAKDNVNIILPAGMENAVITIFNILGQPVWTDKTGTTLSRVADLSRMPAGNYFVWIEQSNVVVSKRIVIEGN